MIDKMVSVIVPVYNAEKYVDTCIGSLVSQTYANIEIIMVDDCSTDNSLEICRGWEKKDDRIKVYILKSNSGPSVARNKGMQEARGEYITFVDADDWMDKMCIDSALEVAIKTKADIVLWNLVSQCGEETTPEHILEGDERVFVGDEIKILCGLILRMKAENGNYALGLGGPFCKLFRMNVLREISFPEKINNREDACFNVQVFNNSNRIVYINKTYYYRRYLDESLSNKVDIDFAERVLQCTNWMLDYCKKKDIVPEGELNNYIYTEFKRVVVHYTKNSFSYGKVAKNKINYFVNNLAVPINWNEINDDSKLKLMMLKRRHYWIYNVFFMSAKLLRR